MKKKGDSKQFLEFARVDENTRRTFWIEPFARGLLHHVLLDDAMPNPSISDDLEPFTIITARHVYHPRNRSSTSPLTRPARSRSIMLPMSSSSSPAPVLATLGISMVLSLHAHPVEHLAETVAPVRPALGVHVPAAVDAAVGHPLPPRTYAPHLSHRP
jgi:hypothetical protein